MKRSLTFILILFMMFNYSYPAARALSTSGSGGNTVSSSVVAADGTQVGDIPGIKPASLAAIESDFLDMSPSYAAAALSTSGAEFQNTSLDLKDDVIMVNNTVTKNIADLGQRLAGSTVQKESPSRLIERGAYVPTNVLDTAAAAAGRNIAPGAICYDAGSRTAFQVVDKTSYSPGSEFVSGLNQMQSALKNTYSIAKPALKDFAEEINIPEQTMTLTTGNLAGFAKDMEQNVSSIGSSVMKIDDSDKRFKYIPENKRLIGFQFKDAGIEGKIGNSTITLKISGGFCVGDIVLDGHYSAFGGYGITLTVDQESYLIVELDAKINEEVTFPIFAVDINIPLIGRVYGGIYGIVGLDGKFRLAIESRMYNKCTAGISGSTFLFLPTSIKPIFKPEKPQMTGDSELNGYINGYIKVGLMAGFELFGFEIVGAGVLLGAGVTVTVDKTMLDIEVYATIDVYVSILGKRINIVNLRPTIFRKIQPDTLGYKVAFIETFIAPGRMGGYIDQEPEEAGEPYVPAVGVDYRIWNVPVAAQGAFTIENREQLLAADKADPNKTHFNKVRTYPADGWAKTNDEGEFIQKSDTLCSKGDNMYLEIRSSGSSIFAGPVLPEVAFKKVSISYADAFNDYIIGKVDPVMTINWDGDRFGEKEQLFELAYYKGAVYVSPFNDYGGINTNPITYGQANTMCDENGVFDTRVPMVVGGVTKPANVIDVLKDVDTEYYLNMPKQDYHVWEWTTSPPAHIGVLTTLDVSNTLETIETRKITPMVPQFAFTRDVSYVENSYKRTFIENGKILDSMAFDETLFIANPEGTKNPTANMLNIITNAFSEVDIVTEANAFYITNGYKSTGGSCAAFSYSTQEDESGNPNGVLKVMRRVVLEWVWQEHPDPVKITSVSGTETDGSDSTFTVTASGHNPQFYVEGAPDGVTIDKKTGVMTISEILADGTYEFFVVAKEGVLMLGLGDPDPKAGHDSSADDIQPFTLTVNSAEKPPIIVCDAYINVPQGTYYVVEPTIAGAPLTGYTVTLKDNSGTIFNEHVTVKGTAITLSDELMSDRNYTLTIRAENEYGSDSKNIKIFVGNDSPQILSTDGYVFMPGSEAPGSRDFVYRLVTGSFPMTINIEAYDASQQPVSDLITVDQNGWLHVSKDIIVPDNSRIYYLYVTASNPYGTINRSLVMLQVGISYFARGSEDTSVNKTSSVYAAAEPASDVSTVIRMNDLNDVYTHDRFVLNGAAFLHWNTVVNVNVVNARNYYQSGTYYIGSSVESEDNTPCADRYHYYSQASSVNTMEFLRLLNEKLDAYQNGYMFDWKEKYSGMQDHYMDYRINQSVKSLSSLEYGSILKQLEQLNKGNVPVTLDSLTGTIVSGKLFESLSQNNRVSMTFEQAGVDITFSGKDIKNADASTVYNFGLTAAPSAKRIADEIGLGDTAFAFGFNYHGSLPGTATFDVQTSFAAGQKVNVYKINGSSGSYSTVAQGLTVREGGIVTYKNNQMSEYVITTKKIESAVKLEGVFELNNPESNMWWYIGSAAAIVVIAALTLTVIFVRKSKKH